MATVETPILIVGAGPVGLALAADLGSRGVPCLAIEQGDGIVRAFAAAGVPLRVEALASPEVRALYERALVLVRPDGHVAWRADQEPADAAALADCVRGAGRLSQMRAVERAS